MFVAVDRIDEPLPNGADEPRVRVRPVAQQAGGARPVGVATRRDNTVGERREGRQGLLAGPRHQDDRGTGLSQARR